MFRIWNSWEQGDALSVLIFNFALVYGIRRIEGYLNGLKLNGTDQLWFYADGVNILGRSLHTVKENTDVLVVASKEIGLEVNGDKTKYMVMSRDQNVGPSYSMEIDSSYFGKVEEFKYLGTNLIYQHSFQELINP
jgi:hypothetical protein